MQEKDVGIYERRYQHGRKNSVSIKLNVRVFVYFTDEEVAGSNN